MKRTIAMLLTLGLLLAFAGCGEKKPAAAPESSPVSGETAAPSPTAEPAQEAEKTGGNPAEEFLGSYGVGRANMDVEAGDGNRVKITVTWGSSAWEKAQWVMSGEFNPETLTVEYTDCVKTELRFNEQDELDETTVIYEKGTGRIRFSAEDHSVTWEDDQENAAEDLVFTADSEPLPADMGDPDHYAPVTAMDKAAVEEICAGIRDAYLSENWEAIANTVSYPITVSGTELKDAESFIAFMNTKTVHYSDRAALEEETCQDMFVNGIGICLGSGQIWICDPSYMTEDPPRLEIIGITGIVDPEEGEG